jgi:5,10-methylenetetrahydrofolate reductase
MTNSEILSRSRFEILPTRGAEELSDERLAPYARDEHYDIAGLHLYTFNQVESMAQWRQRMLAPKKASSTGALR